MINGKVIIRSTIPTAQKLTVATREALREELLALGEALQGRIQGNIRDMGINTTGGGRGLLGSWERSSGSQTGTDVTVRVLSPLPYAAHVEFGTAGAKEKPRKWPPLEPLIAWVAQKMRFEKATRTTKAGVVVSYKKKRWGAGVRKERTPSEQEMILKIARAVQRKIYWYGTKPRLYVKAALTSLQLDAVAEVDKQTQTMFYRVTNLDKWLSTRPIWDSIVRKAKTGK